MSTFLGRLKYYLIGVGLGVIIVYFMFGNRDFQCSYMPNARVLKDIRSKQFFYSDLATCQKDCLGLDSLDIRQLLVAGAIEFSESEPRKEPCGEYELILRLEDMREIHARIENCDSTATLLSIKEKSTDCQCP